MMWDDNEGLRTFFSRGAVDVNSPVRCGEHVTLKMSGIEFEVEVTQDSGSKFRGEICRIGPTPKIEAIGLKRGDRVSFASAHIYTVIRS
ncbi:MAG: hypothetical protein K0U79_09635 [Gammaproteobacteria bacterium]|nr:hypothetical protein [Gammaproteobacteria bacterium]